jgi:hypothetical protein
MSLNPIERLIPNICAAISTLSALRTTPGSIAHLTVLPLCRQLHRCMVDIDRQNSGSTYA